MSGTMAARAYGFNRVSLGGPYFMSSFVFDSQTTGNGQFVYVDKLSNGKMIISGNTGVSGANALLMTVDTSLTTVSSVWVTYDSLGAMNSNIVAKNASDRICMATNGSSTLQVSPNASSVYNSSMYGYYYGLNQNGVGGMYAWDSGNMFIETTNYQACCGPYNPCFIGWDMGSPTNQYTYANLSSGINGSGQPVATGDPTSNYINVAWTNGTGNIVIHRMSLSTTSMTKVSGTSYANGDSLAAAYNGVYKLIHKNGKLYAIGTISDNGTPAGLVQQFALNGTRWDITGAWGKEFYKGSANVTLRDAVFDAAGNMYVLGDSGALAGYLIKIDPSGNVLWQRQLAFSGIGASATVGFNSIALDGSGDVWLAGNMRYYPSGYSYAILFKVPPDGSRTGTYTLPATGSSSATVAYTATGTYALTVKAPYNITGVTTDTTAAFTNISPSTTAPTTRAAATSNTPHATKVSL